MSTLLQIFSHPCPGPGLTKEFVLVIEDIDQPSQRHLAVSRPPAESGRLRYDSMGKRKHRKQLNNYIHKQCFDYFYFGLLFYIGIVMLETSVYRILCFYGDPYSN